MKKYFLTICVLMLNFSFAWAETFTYNDHGKRDPFWRLVTREGMIVNYDKELSVGDMFLEGIIFDPSGKSLAIINGSVVKKNDKIGLYIVTQIEKTKVLLSRGQDRFTLDLKKEE